MKESTELPTHLKSEAKSCEELLAEGWQKLKASLNSTPNFGIQELASSQAPSPATKSNPFAILGEDNVGATTLMEMQEDMKEGWSFQGWKRHDPKQTPPRQVMHHLSPHPSHREITPGGKRGLMHSEVHPSYFTSLGIQVPPSKEPLRARIWPVLTRVKKKKKKNTSALQKLDPAEPTALLQITGPIEAAKTEWTQDSTRVDLIQRLELELEKNILRYKWSIREHLHLEWS